MSSESQPTRGRELRLTISDADPAYIAERVGELLYVHLRGLEASTRFRRGALERAVRLHRAAPEASEPEQTGLGLLVLQRATLCWEDLGALLYAFQGSPDGSRLTSYRLPDLTHMYAAALECTLDLRSLFRFPPDGVMREEPGIDADAQVALERLLAITFAAVEEKLRYVAACWLNWHQLGKKTLHALGFVAGSHALAMPAGIVSDLLPSPLPPTFAVALDSSTDHAVGSVHTTVAPVPLGAGEIARLHLAGRQALDLTELFAQGWLYGLQTSHAYSIPLRYLERLEPEAQAALMSVLERRAGAEAAA